MKCYLRHSLIAKQLQEAAVGGIKKRPGGLSPYFLDACYFTSIALLIF
jgi:hypothetical protein